MFAAPCSLFFAARCSLFFAAMFLFSPVVAISLSGIEESSPSYNLSSAYGYNSTKAMSSTRFNMLFYSYEHISGSSALQSAISIVYAFCGIVFAFTFLIALIVVLRHVKLYWDPLKAAELLRSQNALLESIKVERPNQKTPLVGGGKEEGKVAGDEPKSAA